MHFFEMKKKIVQKKSNFFINYKFQQRQWALLEDKTSKSELKTSRIELETSQGRKGRQSHPYIYLESHHSNKLNHLERYNNNIINIYSKKIQQWNFVLLKDKTTDEMSPNTEVFGWAKTSPPKPNRAWDEQREKKIITPKQRYKSYI